MVNIYENLFQRLDQIESLIVKSNELLNTSNSFNPSERLTRKQVREQYKISFGTLHNLMRQQRLGYEKIGRKTLFKRSDLEACFNSNSN
jgi:hypothetical protein